MIEYSYFQNTILLASLYWFKFIVEVRVFYFSTKTHRRRKQKLLQKAIFNWSLAFSQFTHWHSKVQPQVICKINHRLDCYIANNGNTVHFFVTSERQKTNNNNILNPLLSPPLSNKPSFSEEKSFNNKPPSVLTPTPPPLPLLFFTNK